jgi:hypothetical protein
VLIDSIITPEILEQRKKELKKLREQVEERYGGPMRFYDEILTEERKKELKEQVTFKRRLMNLADLEKRYPEAYKV